KEGREEGGGPEDDSGDAGRSVLAIHSTVVLLRSCSHSPSAPDADARSVGRAGQQRSRGKEQGSLGSSTRGRREPGLHVKNSAEGEPCSMGGEGRKQRGNA